jgi:hypothetical protein
LCRSGYFVDLNDQFLITALGGRRFYSGIPLVLIDQGRNRPGLVLKNPVAEVFTGDANVITASDFFLENDACRIKFPASSG